MNTGLTRIGRLESGLAVEEPQDRDEGVGRVRAVVSESARGGQNAEISAVGSALVEQVESATQLTRVPCARRAGPPGGAEAADDLGWDDAVILVERIAVVARRRVEFTAADRGRILCRPREPTSISSGSPASARATT